LLACLTFHCSYAKLSHLYPELRENVAGIYDAYTSAMDPELQQRAVRSSTNDHRELSNSLIFSCACAVGVQIPAIGAGKRYYGRAGRHAALPRARFHAGSTA
jgi:hypothetical protein